MGKEGLVYAIEAFPRTADSLKTLIKMNGFRNVIVSQIAIGNCDGMILMEDRENHAQNTIKINANEGVQVPIMTFDHFVEQNRISHIDFLKINIEGAEIDLIEGITKSIRIVDNLAVSCHDFLDPIPSNRIRNKLTSFLEANQFQVKTSQDTHPVRRSWLFANKI